MGVFDYVRCKYPLPIEGANAFEFQSKDTDMQWLAHYEIREDGTLWGRKYHDDEPEQDFMTGEVRFYTGTGPPDDGWLEFSAYFVKGELKHLETISDGGLAATKPSDPLQALTDLSQSMGLYDDPKPQEKT